MQYTPTNKRKFERNVAHYTNNVTESPETERLLRTMLKNHDMSGVQRERGEPWGHFMARLTNEYRRKKKNTKNTKKRSPPQGEKSPAKKTKSSNNVLPAAPETKKSNNQPGPSNTPAKNLGVVKKGYRSGGTRDKLKIMKTDEIRKMVNNAGYAYPKIVDHITNNSHEALKTARAYVVYRLVHDIKSKRQPWDKKLFAKAGVTPENHALMLKYMKVFPGELPKELKAQLEPNGKKRYYSANTLRALLGTQEQRDKHIKKLRAYHKKAAQELKLPFDHPKTQTLTRLQQYSKNYGHETLEKKAREAGFDLNHYNKLNNATRREALPHVMYDQVHPDAQKRRSLITASDILTHLAARNNTMNKNATTRELVEAAKNKKIYNLPKLVKSFGAKGDYIRRLVKASGFHRSVEETGKNPETRKELVRYLRDKIPEIDNVVKNSQSP